MIVVDTNVLANLVLPGENTATVDRVVMREPEWATPLLARSELLNTLATWMRRGLLSLESALLAADDADERLKGALHAVPSRDVLELANRSRCTAYDCEFVALARQLGVRLVTSDRQVLAAFPETAITPEAFVAH